MDYIGYFLPSVWFKLIPAIVFYIGFINTITNFLYRTGFAFFGIPEKNDFVAFYSRNSAYLKSLFPHFDFGYHDYRDSKITNYLTAADELTRRGYYVVRMGAVVSNALNTKNHKIIDYSNSYRSEFMDIYLGAKCRFFLGTVGGFNSVPQIFRVPMVLVNLLPLEYIPFHPQDLVIPKKLWHREKKRFLKFREVHSFGLGTALLSEKYRVLGVDPIENTPEEIKAVAVEMVERLKGTWQTTEEDEKLQRKYWSFYSPDHVCSKSELSRSRIGAEFLRQNKELLD